MLAEPALRRCLRYAFLGLRLLFPTPAESRYAKIIRDSGAVDRSWYLACNPRLPRLCRFLPERHYVLVGEAAGVCPSPHFSPRAYAHLNPDQAASGLAPLAHFLANGHATKRATVDHPAGKDAPVLPYIRASDRPIPPARFAIVLHLHYADTWEDFAARLSVQQFRFDLFVTLSQKSDTPDTELRTRIRARFPNARIWTLPNHGRDILPFLHLAKSGVLSSYSAVCKLHGKRSPHRKDGDDWRKALLDGVLGRGDRVMARLNAFLADPHAGLWVADRHRIAGAAWWGPNRARCLALLGRAGIVMGDPDELVFAAGSIFWMKPAAVARFADLPVTATDFEPEMGQVDGTTAHALERAFGALVQLGGARIRQASELDLIGTSELDGTTVSAHRGPQDGHQLPASAVLSEQVALAGERHQLPANISLQGPSPAGPELDQRREA